MKIFLGAESQAPAADMLSRLNRIVSREMLTLDAKDYGRELNDIAIIVILLQNERYEDGGFPERRLFQRKKCAADVRLRMNFEQFLRSSPESRYDLYSSHIINSIESLRKKVSREFKFDELVQDVTKILNRPDVRSKCVAIKRFM